MSRIPLKILSLLLVLLLVSCVQHQNKNSAYPLFPIVIDNKVGYIDTSGKVVIPPAFHNAGFFSDNLAFARKDGLFGYIDKTGEFVIEPQFDLARDFHEGFAGVFINHKLYYIDKHGNKIAGFKCMDGFQFVGGRAVIETYNHRFGMINRQGKLVVDTVFQAIGKFVDGVAVVDTSIKNDRGYGVIDTDGHFIVPFGKYSLIRDYQNGYAYVDMSPDYAYSEKNGKVGFIDKKGHLILSIRMDKYLYMGEILSEGVASIAIPKNKSMAVDGLYTDSEKYWGYVNLTGKLVIKDTAFKEAYEFHDGRAFIKDADEKYRIIDRGGKYVTNRVFNDVYEDRFYKGIAIVQDSNKWWRIIDTNGSFVCNRKLGSVINIDTIRNLILYSQKEHKGVCTFTGDSVSRPVSHFHSDEGDITELTAEILDKKLSFTNGYGNIHYINQNGKVVWSQPPSDGKLENMNIDYIRVSRYVVSEENSSYEPSGKFNFPKKVTKEFNFPNGQVSIIMKSAEKDTFEQEGNKWNGIVADLVNSTDTAVRFSSTCHSIGIVMQALSANNEWVDIEHPDNSWCCTGSSPIELKANKYWSIVIPHYEGSFKTKLRLRINYVKAKSSNERWIQEKDCNTIYSDPIDGSVNPAQLYTEDSYKGIYFYTRGVMSPRFFASTSGQN